MRTWKAEGPCSRQRGGRTGTRCPRSFPPCPHACCSLRTAQEALSGPTCSPSRTPTSLGLGLAPAWRRRRLSSTLASTRGPQCSSPQATPTCRMESPWSLHGLLRASPQPGSPHPSDPRERLKVAPQLGPAPPAPWTFQRPSVAACTPKPGRDLARARTLGRSLGFVQGLAGCWGAAAKAEVRAAPQPMGPARCPAGVPGVCRRSRCGSGRLRCWWPWRHCTSRGCYAGTSIPRTCSWTRQVGAPGPGGEEWATLTLPHPSGRRPPKPQISEQGLPKVRGYLLFPLPPPSLFRKDSAEPGWSRSSLQNRPPPPQDLWAVAPAKTRLSLALGGPCPQGGSGQPGCWLLLVAVERSADVPCPSASSSKMTIQNFCPLIPPCNTPDDKVTSGSRILASGQKWSPSAAGRLWTTSTVPQARRAGEVDLGCLCGWSRIW